jgi:type I restriction enzyme, S subunit
MARQAHWSIASRSPMAWPCVPLHELCEKRTGVRDPRLSPDTVFRYVDISSIDRLTKTVVDARAIAGRDAPSRARKVIKANDVVVSTTRPNLNAVAWIPRDLDGQIASTGFCVLRAAERLDPDYLFAYVRSPAFVASLSNLVVGALYPAVSDRQVMAQTIPLPPLPEQKRIAAALREQLDAAVRMRTAAGEQSTIARQVLANELAKVFGMPPDEGTRRTTLGHVLSRRQDVVHPHDHPQGDIVFVGLEHIESDTGHRTGSLEVDMAKLTGRKPRFIKGDIVYGYLRPYLNKVWIAKFDGLCSVDQYVYEPDSSVIRTEYAAWFMRSSVFLARAPIEQAPGQLPRVRAREVADVAIDLPSLRDQDKHVEALRATSAIVKRLSRAIAEQTGAAGELPAALLRRAFSVGM